MEVVDKTISLAKNMEQDISTSLIENALEDCVSAFDGYGRELCRIYAHCASTQVNVSRISFQNLDQAPESVKKAFGFDLARLFENDAWLEVCRLFQKRHVIAHKMGIVDQEYLSRTRDTSVVEGQKLHIQANQVHKLKDLLTEAAEKIFLEFKLFDSIETEKTNPSS